MKIIREHIFEDFREDSDPIKDMGIGFPFNVGDVVYENNHRKILQYITPNIYTMAFYKTARHPLSTMAGIVIKKEKGGINVKMWIAFFSNKKRIQAEVLPFIEKGLDFFTNLGINVGVAEYSSEEWQKYLRVCR